MSGPSKVLVVTPFPPRRDAAHGGGRVTTEALLHLSARLEVGLLALRAPREEGVDPALVAQCRLVREVERLTARRSPRTAWRERRRFALAARRLPGWAVGHSVAEARATLLETIGSWRPDIVQLEFLVLADLVRGLPRDRPPVVLVDHDARPSPESGSAGAWRRLRRLAAGSVDAFVVFTSSDRELLSRDVGAVPVEVIPPGLDVPPSDGGTAAEGARLLFVGGLAHAPNAHATRRLVDAIFPLVRRRVGEATLTLVGEGIPASLAADGVVVAGRVPDVSPFLAEATVVVAPLTSGGGMRIKVLEALAAGKAIVASPRAVEGLDVAHDQQLLVADGDEETAAAVAAIVGDAALRRRLEGAARAWAERSLGWGSRIDAYEALYERLLSARVSA